VDRDHAAVAPLLSTKNRERSRLDALTVANAVRRARAELKRDIAAGRTSAADVLLDPPAITARLPVGALLMSQPGWGPARCKRFLAPTQINEGKPIGDLTLRQRELLARQLNELSLRGIL
jgi:hypothetical protein